MRRAHGVVPSVPRRTSALPSDDDPSDVRACPRRPAAPACPVAGPAGPSHAPSRARARARMRSSQAPRALARLICRRLEVIRPLDRARVEDLGDVGADARHHPRDDIKRVAPTAHCHAPLFSGRVLFQRATPGDQGTTSARARARMCMRARHRQALAGRYVSDGQHARTQANDRDVSAMRLWRAARRSFGYSGYPGYPGYGTRRCSGRTVEVRHRPEVYRKQPRVRAAAKARQCPAHASAATSAPGLGSPSDGNESPRRQRAN